MESVFPIAIVSVFIGWLLGLLAPAIQERIKSRYLKENMRNGFLTEVNQLKESAADVVLVIEMKLGKFNRELLKWHKSMLGHRKLPPPLDQMEGLSEKFLSLDDPTLRAMADKMKIKIGGGLHLKTFDLPYIRSKLGSLELFSEGTRLHILELLFRVSAFNQQVEDSRFYFKLTFDSKLTEVNHASVVKQLGDIYASASEQAKLLADMCSLTVIDIK